MTNSESILSNGDPCVSVLVPAHNAEGTLLETLNSVLAQDYRPIELVLVDDGSSDGTRDLARQWMIKHDCAAFRCNFLGQPRQGLPACRNLLVRASHGELIQMLDADDVLHPSKLSMCTSAFVQHAVDVVVPRTIRFRSSDEIRSLLDVPPRIKPLGRGDRSALIGVASWFTVGPVFSRRIVSAAGPFPEDLHPVAEEMEFHARVKCLTRKVLYRPEILSFYRVGQRGALTSDLAEVCQSRIQGANRVLALLRTHKVRDPREYRAMLFYTARTFKSAASSQKCGSLVLPAHQALLTAARAWSLPAYLAIRLVPIGALKALSRCV